MEEFLLKLNTIKKENYINSLEKKNIANKQKLENSLSNFKKVFIEKELEIKNLNALIDELTKKNSELEKELKDYKEKLEKLPNWVQKIFNK